MRYTTDVCADNIKAAWGLALIWVILVQICLHHWINLTWSKISQAQGSFKQRKVSWLQGWWFVCGIAEENPSISKSEDKDSICILIISQHLSVVRSMERFCCPEGVKHFICWVTATACLLHRDNRAFVLRRKQAYGLLTALTSVFTPHE